MQIIHYSKTPLASAPYHIVKCLQKYTTLDVTLINESVSYQDGRVFPHIQILTQETSREQILSADIIHTHNQLSQSLKEIFSLKPHGNPAFNPKLFCTMHSSPKMYNWKETIDSSTKSFVIRQPMQIKEYEGVLSESLPTPIDIFSEEFRVIERPLNKIIINFAPSTKHPINMPSSKGCDEVCAILSKLKQKYGDKIEIDFYRNVPHLEDLKRKQKAHIVIDDVVHETWHLTGLFGLSMGCIVFNGIKENDFIDFYNNNYDKKTDKSPFETANLQTLENKLSEIIELPITSLIDRLNASRQWMETYYNPSDLVKYYLKAYNI